jgi:hypothetical protein
VQDLAERADAIFTPSPGWCMLDPRALRGHGEVAMQDGVRRQEWRPPAVEVGDVEDSFAHEASRLHKEHQPMPALKRALARPLRAITWGGVLLGVLLVTGLALMLVNDHHRRLEAAQRQSRALAVGSERLLALELRNLERAMSGIAADAAELFRSVPAQAPACWMPPSAACCAGTPNCTASWCSTAMAAH